MADRRNVTTGAAASSSGTEAAVWRERQPAAFVAGEPGPVLSENLVLTSDNIGSDPFATWSTEKHAGLPESLFVSEQQLVQRNSSARTTPGADPLRPLWPAPTGPDRPDQRDAPDHPAKRQKVERGVPPSNSPAIAAAVPAGTELLVYVDAANVAHGNSLPTELGGKRFTAGLLVAAHDALINWARGDRAVRVTMVIMQETLDNLAKDPHMFALMCRDPEIFARVPSRADDDEFILLSAREEKKKGRDVRILSNDNYDKYREGRSHGIEGVNGQFLQEVLWKFLSSRGEVQLGAMPIAGQRDWR